MKYEDGIMLDSPTNIELCFICLSLINESQAGVDRGLPQEVWFLNDSPP